MKRDNSYQPSGYTGPAFDVIGSDTATDAFWMGSRNPAPTIEDIEALRRRPPLGQTFWVYDAEEFAALPVEAPEEKKPPKQQPVPVQRIKIIRRPSVVRAERAAALHRLRSEVEELELRIEALENEA